MKELRLDDVEMREVHLTTPVGDAALDSLCLGDIVHLTGVESVTSSMRTSSRRVMTGAGSVTLSPHGGSSR